MSNTVPLKLQNPQRRHLLGALMAAGVPLKLVAYGKTPDQRAELWLSAEGADSSAYAFGSIRRSESVSGAVLSGFRGHGCAVHPTEKQRAVMFARRPGLECIEIDLSHMAITQRIPAAKNRHFFGHGCFSADGHLLYTTENDLQTNRGKIVARNTVDYSVEAEFDSGGIGPHEIALMPDHNTLVVANGGMKTRPETGRDILNLESMESNLSYLDRHSGRVVEQCQVDEPKASIRHLDVAPDGTVAIAMQLQRQATGHTRSVPLGALHKRGQPIRLLHDPVSVVDQLKDYMGSVAINPSTGVVGFTSPRGNLAVFWQIDSGEFVGYHALRDVCGLAVSADQKYFVLSSSIGQVRLLDAATLQEDRKLRLLTPGRRWDNHLTTTVL